MIFIPKFFFPKNVLYHNFVCFVSFFESQVLLNISRITKCDTLIRTLGRKREHLIEQVKW